MEAEKRGGGEGHGEKWLNGGGAARGARYTHPSLAMSEKCSHFIPKTINTRSNGGFYNKRRLINVTKQRNKIVQPNGDPGLEDSSIIVNGRLPPRNVYKIVFVQNQTRDDIY